MICRPDHRTTLRRTARASAPGKVILFGEHAVVYGRTAVAAALDRHVAVSVTPSAFHRRPMHDAEDPEDITATGAAAVSVTRAVARAAALAGVPTHGITTTISGNLPVGVGLGSSAALSVALVRALSAFGGRIVDPATVCARAYEIEKLFHGWPSGVDNTVATYGGLIAFRRGAGFRRLATPRSVRLVVALGRTPRRTALLVGRLRRQWAAERGRYESLFDEIDAVSRAAEKALATADLPLLGELMNANQVLLGRLGISTEEIDGLAALARAAGASGVKLSGGGGGGAVIAVGDCEHMLAAYRRAGWQAFVAVVGGTERGTDATENRRNVERAANG